MKFLAIGSHADDVELGCGGTLRAAANKGHEILILIMSRSGYTNHDGKVVRSDAAAHRDALKAAKKLGAKVIFLDFPTKDVPYDSKSVEAINRVLDEFKPDYIFTQWTFDTHQDHRNTALATVSAARNFENIFFYEPFPPSGRSYVGFKPQIYVDISSTIKDKVAAIKCHGSEVKKYGPHWVDSVVGRAKMRGYECNVKYAETFELLRYSLKI